MRSLTKEDPETTIDKNDLFYQVVGVNKGRVCGLRSRGDSGYGIPRASTSTEPEVRREKFEELRAYFDERFRTQQRTFADLQAMYERQIAQLQHMLMQSLHRGDPDASTSPSPPPPPPPPPPPTETLRLGFRTWGERPHWGRGWCGRGCGPWLTPPVRCQRGAPMAGPLQKKALPNCGGPNFRGRPVLTVTSAAHAPEVSGSNLGGRKTTAGGCRWCGRGCGPWLTLPVRCQRGCAPWLGRYIDSMFPMLSSNIGHDAALWRDDQGVGDMDEDWLHDLGMGRHDKAPQ
ncbi:hypothetical protein Sjap_026088 [Stephania japonica]|uniref:Uncharacterized protein n=1 Tax=Stephania japonica TaxID=461633 RepID=A0AAP0HI61_9MAGN